MTIDGPTTHPPANGDGRVVLVTGAARGLGAGLARAFAADGCAVALVDVDPAVAGAADDLAASGVPVAAHVADVSQRDDFARAIEDVVERFGRVDVLVNNAQAGGQPAPLVDTTPEHLDLAMRSGFVGTFNGMQLAHPHLRASRGCVLNLVSGAAISAPAGYSAYASAKSAIRTLTRIAAVEWGPIGVRVNAISPSARTPALDQWARENPEEYERRATQIPLGRFGDPETDIGAVAVFLASPAASYITGQTIVVDGGAHYLG